MMGMAFNLGVDGLMKLNRTLAAVRWGDYSAAAEAMLASRSAGQVKGRAVGLAQMIRSGEDFG
jgi:hypothetical protein